MMEQDGNSIEWRGPFRKGQLLTYDGKYLYCSEYPGVPGVFYYIMTDMKYEKTGLDLVFKESVLANPLKHGNRIDRLAWFFNQDSGEYALTPRFDAKFNSYSILNYDIEDHEGTVYLSGAGAHQGRLFSAQLLGAAIQLSRGAEEMRSMGPGVGSPGLWGLYIQTNRRARLVGGGLRWVLEGEELPESADLAHVKEFILSFVRTENPSEEEQSLTVLLQGGEAESFRTLTAGLEKLYGELYGAAFATEKKSEAPGFEERLGRAIGIGNLGKYDEARKLLDELRKNIHEAGDEETAIAFWNNYAAFLIISGNAEEGLALIEEKVLGESSQMWLSRALGYERTGRIDEADMAFRRSMELEPENRSVMFTYADFCYRLQRRESFLLLYAKMLETLGDRDVELWTMIGDFLANPDWMRTMDEQERDLTAALDAYDRALESGGEKKSLAIKKLKARVLLGDGAGAADADEFYSRIRDAGDPLLLNELGHLYGVLLRSDESEKCYRKAHELDPENEFFAYNIIISLRDRFLNEDAARFAEEWLDLYRREPEAMFWNELGYVFLCINRFEKAVECFTRALGREPGNERYAIALGNAMITGDKDEEALEFADRWLTAARSERAGHFLNELGMSFFFAGKHERAEVCYRRALEFEPDNKMYIANVCNALVNLKRSEEAFAFAQERAESALPESAGFIWNDLGGSFINDTLYEKAEICCRRALALEPLNEGFAESLARSLIFQEKFREALAFIHEWADGEDALLDEYFWSNIALAFEEKKQYDEAEKIHKKALGCNNENNSTVMHIARLLNTRGKHDEAADFIREWTAGDGRVPNGYILNELGCAYKGLKRFAEAEDSFRRALECFPWDEITASYLLQSIALQGRNQDAVLFAEEWISAEERVPGPVFLGELAGAYNALQRYEEADAACRRALEIDPADVYCAGNLLKTLNNREHYEDALNTAEEWLSVEGRSPDAFFSHEHGMACAMLKRFDEAEKHLAQALQLNPDNPIALESMLKVRDMREKEC